MSPLLNLSEYDEQQFEALQPGRYFAEIFDIEERYTKDNPDAKMPPGTPMIWIHFQITGRVGEDSGPDEDSSYYNRRAFRNLVIPPEGYDAKASRAMKGMLVSFFQALGVPKETITSDDWEPDLEDFKERPLIIQLNRKPNRMTGEMDNNVIGFRNISDGQQERSGLL